MRLGKHDSDVLRGQMNADGTLRCKGCDVISRSLVSHRHLSTSQTIPLRGTRCNIKKNVRSSGCDELDDLRQLASGVMFILL